MKNARPILTAPGKAPARSQWPQPADLSPIRTSTVAAATRGAAQGVSEPPVRPVPGWRLPSGQLLVEYALRAGLASSPLLVRLPLLGAGSMAKGNALNVGDTVIAPSLVALAGKLGAQGAVKASGKSTVKAASGSPKKLGSLKVSKPASKVARGDRG